jgi:hypothetical protein
MRPASRPPACAAPLRRSTGAAPRAPTRASARCARWSPSR